MVKRLLLVLTLIAATAATTSPVKKNADGSVTIDTSTLKTVEGYMGPTPLVVHVDAQGLVSRIEALPNEETPAYWRLAMEGLSKAWNGLPADEAVKLEVDAVSGATFPRTPSFPTSGRESPVIWNQRSASIASHASRRSWNVVSKSPVYQGSATSRPMPV